MASPIDRLGQIGATSAMGAGGGGTFSVGNVLDPYMWVFFAAFLTAIVMTPIMRWVAVRSGIVDWPDLKRKSHIEPVAYLGGVALFLAWAAGMAVCFLIRPHYATGNPAPPGSVGFPVSIFIGAAIVAITGLCDDVYGISPRVKLGGQILAAAALSRLDVGEKLISQSAIAVGIELPEVASYVIGTIVLAAFVVGCCNAMNLIDGLDGLAAGVSAISATGFLFIAVFVAMIVPTGVIPEATRAIYSDPIRIILCLALLGALLGFLPYNFNPANIFMGDAGSLVIGYLCAASMLMFAEVPVLGPKLVMAAIIIFALPISDTALAIFRRLMRGQPIFSPDSQHIHHVLIRTGMTIRKAVISLYGLSLFFAVIGCSLVFVPWRYVAAIFLVIFGFVLVTAYKIGHRQLLRQKQAVARHAPAATPLATPRPLTTQTPSASTPSQPSSTPVLPARPTA